MQNVIVRSRHRITVLYHCCNGYYVFYVLRSWRQANEGRLNKMIMELETLTQTMRFLSCPAPLPMHSYFGLSGEFHLLLVLSWLNSVTDLSFCLASQRDRLCVDSLNYLYQWLGDNCFPGSEYFCVDSRRCICMFCDRAVVFVCDSVARCYSLFLSFYLCDVLFKCRLKAYNTHTRE